MSAYFHHIVVAWSALALIYILSLFLHMIISNPFSHIHVYVVDGNFVAHRFVLLLLLFALCAFTGHHIYHIDVYFSSPRTINRFGSVTLITLSVQKCCNHCTNHVYNVDYTETQTDTNLHSHRHRKNASSNFFLNLIRIEGSSSII